MVSGANVDGVDSFVYLGSLMDGGNDKMLSYRRETRAAGCVTVFAKSRRLELGDNILRTL